VPEFLLKKSILSNFPTGNLEPAIADSVDFMVDQLEQLDQSQIASRLKLNTLPSPLKPNGFPSKDRVTIIDVRFPLFISTTFSSSFVILFLTPHFLVATLLSVSLAKLGHG